MRKFHFEPLQAIKNALRTSTTHADLDEIIDEQNESSGDEPQRPVDDPDWHSGNQS